MDKETIKSILLAHGFTIKPGETDLKPYVYKAAFELLELATPAVQGDLVAWATRLYNTAYHAGHNDTVEGNYTHVYRQDMDSYHEDIVQEWLADNPQHAEQQSAPEVVGWQFYQDGRWWNGDDRTKDHKKNTLAAGFRVRDVYAVQQPEERPEPEGECRKQGGDA